MPKIQHRYEGESRFAKLIGVHHRTLRRCRIRGVIEPDAFFGARPAYRVTLKRAQSIKRAIVRHLQMNEKK
jgi:hypothetical protein